MSVGDQNGFYHSPNNTSTGSYYNHLWSRWLKDKVVDTAEDVFLCPSREGANWSSE